jgi:hypothetical protein
LLSRNFIQVGTGFLPLQWGDQERRIPPPSRERPREKNSSPSKGKARILFSSPFKGEVRRGMG